MQRDSFEIRDQYGPIDSEMGLQRSLDEASDGVCVLEIRLHPLWKRIQELDAELHKLTTSDTAAALATERAEALAEARAAAQEARIMEKVRVELASMQENLQVSAQGHASNFVPLLQSIAMEQLDVRNKVHELEVKHVEIASQVASDVELQSELQGVNSRIRDAENGIRNLQAEARRIEQRCIQPEAGVAKSPSQSSHGREAWKLDLGLEDHSGGYSLKSSPQRRAAKGHDGQQIAGGPTSTPFAWCTAPRQLDRAASGCRSLPQLA